MYSRRARLAMTVSPGPDRLPARQLRAVPFEVHTRIFNIIIWCGKLPTHLSISRIKFILKKDAIQRPAHSSPICIFSVLTNFYTEFLAQRIDGMNQLNEQQRAFRVEIQHSSPRNKSLYMATFNTARTSDSV